MAARAIPRRLLCIIKAIMEGLIGEAEITNNPFDASWQSVNGGGSNDFGEDWQPENSASLHL